MDKFEPYRIEDFKCKCGRCKNEISSEIVDKCNEIYKSTNVYFPVNSGYRCYSHNREVKGSLTSSHINGTAADLGIRNSNERFVLIKALVEAGVKRFGVAKTFIHFDIDEEKPDRVVWTY